MKNKFFPIKIVLSLFISVSIMIIGTILFLYPEIIWIDSSVLGIFVFLTGPFVGYYLGCIKVNDLLVIRAVKVKKLFKVEEIVTYTGLNKDRVRFKLIALTKIKSVNGSKIKRKSLKAFCVVREFDEVVRVEKRL